MISASKPEWIASFTGWGPGQFRKSGPAGGQARWDEIRDGRPGRGKNSVGLPTEVSWVAVSGWAAEFGVVIEGLPVVLAGGVLVLGAVERAGDAFVGAGLFVAVVVMQCQGERLVMVW